MICVFFGVCGSGKTKVGSQVALTMNCPFLDADDFHPPANRAKMAAGTPLEDADRYHWIESIRAAVEEGVKTASPLVLACSALREDYRQRLSANRENQWLWLLLHGPEMLIRQRLEARRGHFMPASLLDSQLATLEIPKYAWHLSIEKPVNDLVQEAITRIRAAEHTPFLR